MVFGPLIGAGIGALAGVGIGSAVFSGDRPKDFGFVTEAADRNDNIRTPAAANVTDEMRAIIPLTPDWTFWPDYDRWMMINRLLRLIWPKLTTAILKEVITIVKPILQSTLNGIPAALGVVEDICLGPYSLLDADHLDPHVADKLFTLGDHPARLGGMKVYHTDQDTCILEVPVMWGSNAQLDVQVYLRAGPVRLVVPVSVSHIQFRAIARCVLDMVDTIPCIGGATVSLLAQPHVDFRLALFNGPDLMALPGVKALSDYIIGFVVKQLMLYPNSVSVPLMANFGAPPDPVGMLHITLQRMENVRTTDLLTKGDPYVVFEVREGRAQRSKVVKSSKEPVYNEEFFLVVDDPRKQRLSIKVFDYDRLMPYDDQLGVSEVFFSEERVATDEATGGQKVVYDLADFVRTPMLEKKLVLPIRPAGAGLLKMAGKLAAGAASAAKGVASEVGRVVGLGPSANEDVKNLTTIKVAKTAREVRLLKEQEEAKEAAAKALADAAAKQKEMEAAKDAAKKAGLAGPSGGGAAAAAAAPIEWTDDDEAALWAEWKRLADEKKAAAAAEAKRRKRLTKAQREAEDKEKARLEAAAKAADEAIVLVDEQVELRGNGEPMPAGAKPVATMYLTVQFMPFDKPHFDDDVELRPVKSGLSAFVPFDPPPPREIITNVNDFQKGLLTVTIFKASGLAVPGSLLNPDPYVEMVLADCDRTRPNETQRSTVKRNDDTPRWVETFDFVFVSAGSVLTFNVKNKVTIIDAVASLKLSKARFIDPLMGRVQVRVADIARNGYLKDTWPLQDAESGTLEMKLSWQNLWTDQYIE